MDFTHDLSINTIGDTEGHRCDSEYNLNFDDKWYKYVATQNEKFFGCSVPWHPPIRSKKQDKEIEICRNPKLAANATRYFIEHKYSPLSKELVPCARYDLNLGIPDVTNDRDPNKAYLKFYFKMDVKQKSTVIYYDSTTLAAEIGGYIGMFLGVSLVDLAIIFNSLSLSLIKRMFR